MRGGKVLANLGNFAYDPINFEHLRALQVVPGLFLDALSEEDPSLVRFGLAGLLNSAADPLNARLIVDEEDGLTSICEKLLSADSETALNAVSCLIVLLDPGLPWQDHLDRIDGLARESLHHLSQCDTPHIAKLAGIALQRLPERREAPT